MATQLSLGVKISPKEAECIGVVIAFWSSLENDLAMMLIEMMQLDRKIGRAVCVPLNFPTKLDLIPVILRRRGATDAHKKQFRKMRKALLDLSELRNLVAHGICTRNEAEELVLLTFKGGKERANAFIGSATPTTMADLRGLFEAIDLAHAGLRKWWEECEPTLATLPGKPPSPTKLVSQLKDRIRTRLQRPLRPSAA